MKISKVSSMSFWEKSASFDTVEIMTENMLVSGMVAGVVRVAVTLWIAAVRVSRALSTVFLTWEKAWAVNKCRTLRRSLPVDMELLARLWDAAQ